MMKKILSIVFNILGVILILGGIGLLNKSVFGFIGLVLMGLPMISFVRNLIVKTDLSKKKRAALYAVSIFGGFILLGSNPPPADEPIEEPLQEIVVSNNQQVEVKDDEVDDDKSEEAKDEPKAEEPEQPQVEEMDWYGTFSKYSLSNEQIDWIEEVFTNVGIDRVDLMENNYDDCSTGMCVFRSTFLDSKNLQVNFTLEDGKLFYVSIAGIPSENYETYISWSGKVKTKSVGSTATCDMYSDTEGGYLHYYDEADNKILTYDEKTQK